MGIQGLLPLLKSIIPPAHIKDFKDCSVAVDTYSWLHKGALSCSRELCKGIPTSKHIDYCMHRVNLLRHYGVKPVLVFDGGLLPMKSDQENKRARSRKENMSRAMEHESNGNLSAAYECYQKAVDISPSIAYELIQVLKKENICYVVAPYEADAQMTFLALSNQVDAVITEDSDLVAFGCPRVIYKMDKFGQCVEFRYSMLQQNKDLSFSGFTQQMILEMCILSGCDYLPSLPGMGLKKAHALIKKFKQYEKVLKHLKYNGVTVPPIYEENFEKAILTFRHQRVYDPVTEEIIHLSKLSTINNDGDFDFLGPSIPQHLAKAIAEGNLDPISKMPFEDKGDGGQSTIAETYQLKQFNPDSGKKRIDLPVQKNLLTNYFCSASLEAKRAFRVPRNTPEQLCPDKEAFGITTYNSRGSNHCAINNSPEEKMDPVDWPADTKDLEIQEICHPGIDKKQVLEKEKRIDYKILQQPLYKPCIALRKDNQLVQSQSKTGAEKPSKIVRSSYFVKNSSMESNESSKNDRDDAGTYSFQAHISSYEYKSSMDNNEKKLKTVDRNVITKSRYFQSKARKGGVQNDKNEMPLEKETIASRRECRLDMDEVDWENTNAKRDRQRGDFSTQSLRKVNLDRENEKLSGEDIISTDIEECSIPEASLAKRDFAGDTAKKRKVTFLDTAEAEDYRTNDLLTGEVTPLEGDNSDIGDTDAGTPASEGKFGSNISHLGRYSQIAEKSMENFVSVISSFRFTSTGSRASGLRPPLKDIKNTSSSRSTSKMDIKKFAYEPKMKASLKRRV